MLSSAISMMIASNLPIFLGSLLLWIVVWSVLRRNKEKDVGHIPGPKPLPILGNSLLFAGPSETVWLPTFMWLRQKYGPVVRLTFGNETVILISSPEDAEKILASSKHISKAFTYKFFWPWLGQGLLTSTGSHWKLHRKLLTPAFHFRILEDFLLVMNEQADVLCQKLAAHSSGGGVVDLYPLVTHCALDIICETAMGRKINAQASCNSAYIKSVYESQALIFRRMTSPWLWNDFFHTISSCGRNLAKCLHITHAFTEKVIKERKLELNEKLDKVMNEDDVGIKPRLSFLDLLITASKGGTGLSDIDIREEVDTFMFEGHDTTASNISLTLYLLALHPQLQNKCHSELDEIFGDSSRAATSADLKEMKYIHCCIKESLRLYGSVPSIARRTAEKVELGGFVIPADTNVSINIALLHRDPNSFPQPQEFIPERFSGETEHCRHPYAYIPFSAGPRNCIGQKFATMEEKAVISRVLRSVHLTADVAMEHVPLLPELVLKPRDGLEVKLQPREKRRID